MLLLCGFSDMELRLSAICLLTDRRECEEWGFFLCPEQHSEENKYNDDNNITDSLNPPTVGKCNYMAATHSPL